MKTQSVDTSPEAERVLISLPRGAAPARKSQMIVSAILSAIEHQSSFNLTGTIMTAGTGKKGGETKTGAR